MNRYIINRTAVSISTDVELSETISTDDIFTQQIRDMILERLDELIFDMPLDAPAVEVTLSISKVGDVSAPVRNIGGT